MTCITAYTDGKRSFIAGDKLGSDGFTKAIQSEPKVFEKQFIKINDDEGLTRIRETIAFGYTTSFRMGQLLMYSLELPTQNIGQSFTEYLVLKVIPIIRQMFKDEWGSLDTKQNIGGGQFIILHNHEIYEVQNDFSVLSSDNNYASVGSGTHHAMASMAAFEMSDDVFERVADVYKIVSTLTTGVSAEHDVIYYGE